MKKYFLLFALLSSLVGFAAKAAILGPLALSINNTSVSGSQVLTSNPISLITTPSSATFDIWWTGTLTGTFSIQGSFDYNPNTGAGDWYDIGAVISPAAGAAGNRWVQLQLPSWGYVRLVYTNSSGSGTFYSWVHGH